MTATAVAPGPARVDGAAVALDHAADETRCGGLMANENNDPASAPCSLHEWQQGVVPSVAEDVSAWRNMERKRLRTLVAAMPGAAREAADRDIAVSLSSAVSDLLASTGRTVRDTFISVYWPLQREPDIRSWYTQAATQGLQLLLPVVTERNAPLSFRRWSPGAELSPDLLGIPAATGAQTHPDLLIAPCAGFDEHGYRLGNGGGYYDRTMAALPDAPVLIGVAYEHCRLRSIYPQPHDVQMQAVVTETAVWRAEPDGR